MSHHRSSTNENDELVCAFVAALGARSSTEGVDGDLGASLARRLLARWSEPHRRYHGVPHLVATLNAVHALSVPSRTGRAPALGAEALADVELAAWFHDAIYTGAAGLDEQASAALAGVELTALGLPAAHVAEVARLVRLTAGHAPASADRSGQVLCDADLSVLGADEPGYRAYARAVRAEYAQVPAAEFRTGRAAVLTALAAAPTLYRTPRGRRWWQAGARANIAAELARLSDPDTPLDGDPGAGPLSRSSTSGPPAG